MLTHAMLFAAGLGTRMRPLTDQRPKALVEVAGKPLIEYVLERFEAARCQRIVVNTHHFAEQLTAYLETRASKVELVRSHEERLLETGGAVVKALPLLGAAPFFTSNTDAIWFDRGQPALERLRAHFDPQRMDALLLLQPLSRLTSGMGSPDFGLNASHELTRGGERPYAFTGVQVLHPRLFEGRALAPFSLRDAWFASARPDGSLARIHGLVHEGEWMPVGTPLERSAAERKLAGTC